MTTPTPTSTTARKRTDREAKMLRTIDVITELTDHIGTNPENWQYDDRNMMRVLLTELSKEWRQGRDY